MTLSASGAVTVGTAGGYLTSSYSSFFSGAASTLSVAGGATATAASDVTVADGTLTAQGTGTSLTIGGNLVLGTPIPSATEPPYLSGASGSLSVSGGAKVAIAGAITDAYPSYSFTNSAISVSGQGSSLTAGGTLTLDASEGTGTASASGGGVLRVGGLTLVDTSYLSYYEPSLSVDSTSSVEIGTAGAGAAGAITVDTGVTVAMTVPASLNANVVDNGVISETGGALAISGTLSGTGTVQIGAGDALTVGGLAGTVQIQLGASASMTLDGAATADDTIAFDGTGAALTIGAAETYNYATQSETFTPYTDAATLTGFTTGDGIIVDDSTLTNAVYTYNGNNTGTLALFAGTTAVENTRSDRELFGKKVPSRTDDLDRAARSYCWHLAPVGRARFRRPLTAIPG